MLVMFGWWEHSAAEPSIDEPVDFKWVLNDTSYFQTDVNCETNCEVKTRLCSNSFYSARCYKDDAKQTYQACLVSSEELNDRLSDDEDRSVCTFKWLNSTVNENTYCLHYCPEVRVRLNWEEIIAATDELTHTQPNLGLYIGLPVAVIAIVAGVIALTICCCKKKPRDLKEDESIQQNKKNRKLVKGQSQIPPHADHGTELEDIITVSPDVNPITQPKSSAGKVVTQERHTDDKEAVHEGAAAKSPSAGDPPLKASPTPKAYAKTASADFKPTIQSESSVKTVDTAEGDTDDTEAVQNGVAAESPSDMCPLLEPTSPISADSELGSAASNSDAYTETASADVQPPNQPESFVKTVDTDDTEAVQNGVADQLQPPKE